MIIFRSPQIVKRKIYGIIRQKRYAETISILIWTIQAL